MLEEISEVINQYLCVEKTMSLEAFMQSGFSTTSRSYTTCLVVKDKRADRAAKEGGGRGFPGPSIELESCHR